MDGAGIREDAINYPYWGILAGFLKALEWLQKRIFYLIIPISLGRRNL